MKKKKVHTTAHHTKESSAEEMLYIMKANALYEISFLF